MLDSDAFCLFYNAQEKTVKALNGSGHSPEKLTMEFARQKGWKGSIPLSDLNTVTVPGQSCLDVRINEPTRYTGAAAAWIDTIETFGSGDVTVADVFAPAIRLAEEGYVDIILYEVLAHFL